MSLVIVNNAEVNELISRGQRVVTFEMIATVHQVPYASVSESYRRNAENFVDGKDTWVIEGEELQLLKDYTTLDGRVPSLRVFSEIGYYLLIKPMRDKTSWSVQRQMAETYFKVSNLIAAPSGNRPTTEAIGIVEDYLKLAELFGAPKHIGLIEASKAIKPLGVDATPLLQASPAMDNIAENDLWLEPTELGRRSNMTAQDMNKMLASMGLQAKMNGQWEPTDDGRDLCMKHSWSSNHSTKSGYNLKWNVTKVEALMDSFLERY